MILDFNIVSDHKEMGHYFKNYVEENWIKIRKMKYKKIESLILEQFNNPDKAMENIVLMSYLWTFNKKTTIWDYYENDEYSAIIDNYEWLIEQGLKNYWELKIINEHIKRKSKNRYGFIRWLKRKLQLMGM